MNIPKVSAVMHAATDAEISHLRDSIGSILDQAFVDFEFIIMVDVDAGHAIRDVVESFPDLRIRRYAHANNGISKALNAAIKVARGELIAIVDPSGYSVAERFSAQVHFLDEHKDIGLVGSRYEMIDNDGLVIKKVHGPAGEDNVRNAMLLENPLCFGSLMIRKSIFARAGYFDEEDVFIEGYDSWLRMSEFCGVDILPSILHKKRSFADNRHRQFLKTEKARIEEIRETHIRSLLRANRIDNQQLWRLARSHPDDKLIVEYFFNTFDINRKQEEAIYVDYLILKFLHETNRAHFLNVIARMCIEHKKKGLAYMCAVESLRIDPMQTELLELAESLQEYASPKYVDISDEETCAVSVIMPTYNRHEEIRESIESVLGQTFQDFELIVINDGGGEAVEGIIRSFQSTKIVYHKLDRNIGLAGALNEGIKRARGRYIAYLDDDDVYYPNHLETLFTCITEAPGYECVYSNSWWCYGDLRNTEFVPFSKTLLHYRPRTFSRDLLLAMNYISTLNILHARECFRRCGAFREDLGKLMDWDLWIRFSSSSKFLQIDDITGEYRWKQTNMSHENRLEMKFLQEIIKHYHEYCCGKMALLRCFLVRGDAPKANSYLEDILSNYQAYVKTTALISELFSISKEINHGNRKKFQKMVLSDYVSLYPRKCVADVLRSNNFHLILHVVPYLPLIVSKRLLAPIKNRVMEFLTDILGRCLQTQRRRAFR